MKNDVISIVNVEEIDDYLLSDTVARKLIVICNTPFITTLAGKLFIQSYEKHIVAIDRYLKKITLFDGSSVTFTCPRQIPEGHFDEYLVLTSLVPDAHLESSRLQQGLELFSVSKEVGTKVLNAFSTIATSNLGYKEKVVYKSFWKTAYTPWDLVLQHYGNYKDYAQVAKAFNISKLSTLLHYIKYKLLA